MTDEKSEGIRSPTLTDLVGNFSRLSKRQKCWVVSPIFVSLLFLVSIPIFNISRHPALATISLAITLYSWVVFWKTQDVSRGLIGNFSVLQIFVHGAALVVAFCSKGGLQEMGFRHTFQAAFVLSVINVVAHRLINCGPIKNHDIWTNLLIVYPMCLILTSVSINLTWDLAPAQLLSGRVIAKRQRVTRSGTANYLDLNSDLKFGNLKSVSVSKEFFNNIREGDELEYDYHPGALGDIWITGVRPRGRHTVSGP